MFYCRYVIGRNIVELIKLLKITSSAELCRQNYAEGFDALFVILDLDQSMNCSLCILCIYFCDYRTKEIPIAIFQPVSHSQPTILSTMLVIPERQLLQLRSHQWAIHQQT